MLFVFIFSSFTAMMKDSSSLPLLSAEAVCLGRNFGHQKDGGCCFMSVKTKQ